MTRTAVEPTARSLIWSRLNCIIYIFFVHHSNIYNNCQYIDNARYGFLKISMLTIYFQRSNIRLISCQCFSELSSRNNSSIFCFLLLFASSNNATRFYIRRISFFWIMLWPSRVCSLCSFSLSLAMAASSLSWRKLKLLCVVESW